MAKNKRFEKIYSQGVGNVTESVGSVTWDTAALGKLHVPPAKSL